MHLCFAFAHRRRPWFHGASWIRIGALVLATTVALPAQDVPPKRLTRLSRGVNLAHWFWWAQEKEAEHKILRTKYVADDFAQMRASGIRFIRLTIDPTLFFDEANPAQLKPEFLPDLDAALDLMNRHDLAVIVAPFPNKEFRARFDQDDALVQKFTAFWQALARHLAPRSPDDIVLEVMNEPSHHMTPQRWESIQAGLLAAMRAGAPNDTLIANSNQGGGGTELPPLTPFADRNIVYDFHFYDLHAFTHQGVGPGKPGQAEIHGLLYPVDAANKAQAGVGVSATAKKLLAEYNCNRAVFAASIGQTAAWAQRNHVAVICDEMGVNTLAPAESRCRWFSDVRQILEGDHIGWAVWDYDSDGFGVAHPDHGHRIPDPAAFQALGLKP